MTNTILGAVVTIAALDTLIRSAKLKKINLLIERIRLAKGSIQGSNERIRAILKRAKKNGLDSASKSQLKTMRNFNKVSKSILLNAKKELKKLVKESKRRKR